MTDIEPKPHRLLRAILISMTALCLIALALTLSVKFWLDDFATTPQSSIKQQLFSVKKGDTAKQVIKRLSAQHLIETPLAYRGLLLSKPALARLKVGRYRLSDNMTPIELFTQLSSGIEAQFSITLLEGATFKQWLALLSDNPHIKLGDEPLRLLESLKNESPSSDVNYPHGPFEGMFFPDTYHFSDQSSALDLLNRAQQPMLTLLKELWQDRQTGLPLTSPYQALILASIIEKETGIASERQTIASVFINRLRLGMRLQTDPTVIYGAGKDYAGDITRVHLRDANPYNTYRMHGLPPTPIAMVSRGALTAALNPSQTDYLYFVAAGDGSHYFSKTLREHNKALRRYLALRKQQ